jgi:diadenosine tetraphosphate (Ap4A) HIT family hydrolase
MLEAEVEKCLAQIDMLEHSREYIDGLEMQVAQLKKEIAAQSEYVAAVEADNHALHESLADALGFATPPSAKEAEQHNSSRPTEGEPVLILITIDPANRKNWTFVQKMRAALPSTVTIVPQGPVEHVRDFTARMEEHVAEYQALTAKVPRLEKANRALEKQVASLKQNDCTNTSHRGLLDHIRALELQVKQNDVMLASYGQKLQALTQSKEKLEREAFERSEEQSATLNNE